MDPINYNIDVQSPFDAAMKGYQNGLALKQVEQQQQAQKQMQMDLAQLASKQNPTVQDYASVMTKYPQLSEHFKRSWDILNADQQQAKLSQATQVYSALQSGAPDVAIDMLNKQAQAYRNSGQEQQAQASEAMAKFIQLNPEAARTSAALGLSAVMGPDKFASTFSTLQKLPSEISKNEADVRNIDSGIAKNAAEIRNLDSQIGERASRLKLDRDKLQSDVELKLYELGQKNNTLDDQGKKLVNDSVIASVAADQSSGQMLDLANRLDKTGGGYGAFSTAGEWMKKMTGNQNAITEMRQEYTRLRNSSALKMLPPGSASDKDVAFAMQGFPPDTADAAAMSSFLRGMAKLQQYSSVVENAKAEWVNAVGHLGKPKTDIVIDGINVPAGSTFTDFTHQYMGSKVEQRAKQQAQQQIPNRSYMRWAQPGAK